MEYSLDVGAWNAVFAVPCALVDRHIKLAGKEQLQVILWLLRHAGESFSAEGLSEALGISRDSVLDALDYWMDRGLVAEKSGALFPVPQAAVPAKQKTEPAAEKPEEIAAEAQEPPAETTKIPKKRLAKPNTAYLAARMQQSDVIRSLLQEAEGTLGILSPAMTSVIIASTDDYGLPAEVVVMLLHYAKEVGKTGAAYIDSVARDWAESGIFTLEAAEEKLQELSKKRLAWGKVSSAAGLVKRSPSKKEEEAAYRWVYEWGFLPELLTAAYERCVDNTGKFSAAYMNRILERWHKKDIHTLEQVAAEEQSKQEEKSKNTSYDIDEVERLSFFDLPEDL
ncbi:MAG: DnaD domain protein [Acutalibacter sp.]|nr:DnaD domain protein [Acutalibacter sp.]